METIKIRRQGYSHRIPFVDFVQRYAFLAFSCDEQVVANKESARILLLRLNLDGWALGKTKVFLKYYHIDFLAKIYEDQLKKIVRVQALVRRWIAKKRVSQLRRMISSGLVMQKYTRGWLARKRVGDMKNTLTKCKNANRQHSPDFAVTPTSSNINNNNNNINNNNNNNNGKSNINIINGVNICNVKDLPSGSTAKDKSHLDFRYEREKEFTSFESPEKAAVLIQKCVRGYLTRKMVKNSQRHVIDNGSKQQQQQINQLHHQQQHQLHHQPQQQHRHQQQQQQVHHQSQANVAGQGGHFISRRMQSYQPNVVTVVTQGNHNNSPLNGHQRLPGQSSGANATSNIPQLVTSPNNARTKEATSSSSKGVAQFTSSLEKENRQREKLWWQVNPNSHAPNSNSNRPSEGARGDNNNKIGHHGHKALVEVGSWSQRASGTGGAGSNVTSGFRTSGSVVTVTVKDHQAKILSDQQQGPFEFRKILKPSPRDSGRIASSHDDLLAIASSTAKSSANATGASWGSCNSDSGPFDFRKLLRRTNHAPTDTLKRCKGLLAPVSGEASSV